MTELDREDQADFDTLRAKMMTVWKQLINEIDGFTTDIRSLPVFQRVTPAEIRSELESHYSFE